MTIDSQNAMRQPQPGQDRGAAGNPAQPDLAVLQRPQPPRQRRILIAQRVAAGDDQRQVQRGRIGQGFGRKTAARGGRDKAAGDGMIAGAIEGAPRQLVRRAQGLDRRGQGHQRIIRRQDEPDAQRLIRHAAPASQKPCACPLQANSCPLKANNTRNLAYLSCEERRIGVLAP